MTDARLERALADAIVSTAVTLGTAEADGALHEALLAEPRVQTALRCALVTDAASQRELIIRLAIDLARAVLDVWLAHYPEENAPEEAVKAAEEWSTCPCEDHAEAAAAAAAVAGQRALDVWRQPAKAAAWAGRTAAWAADAPKHGWQAVAAICGACHATSTDRIAAAAEAFLSRAATP